VEIIGYGAAGVYHEYGQDGWTGPTGIYVTDYRTPLAAAAGATWTPLYFWANPEAYTYPYMYLSIEPAEDYPPRPNALTGGIAVCAAGRERGAARGDDVGDFAGRGFHA